MLLIFAVIGGLILWAGIHAERKRREFWQNLANQWSYRYRPGDPYCIAERYDFPLFKEGHSRKVGHLIEGTLQGKQILLFDYTYKTGSGKHQTTHSFSILMLETPIFGSQLTLYPENTFHRLAAFFGFDDINFEFEEFNRAFHVKCEDKKFAYDVFHTGMMEYLLPHRSLAIQWSGAHIIFYSTTGGRFDQEEAEQFRQIAHGFLERLPQYLLDAQKGA